MAMTGMAIFWMIWFFLNGSISIPLTVAFKTDGGRIIYLPFLISRWWDILFSGIWMAIIIFIVPKKIGTVKIKEMLFWGVILVAMIIGAEFGAKSNFLNFFLSVPVVLCAVFFSGLILGIKSHSGLDFGLKFCLAFCIGTGLTSGPFGLYVFNVIISPYTFIVFSGLVGLMIGVIISTSDLCHDLFLDPGAKTETQRYWLTGLRYSAYASLWYGLVVGLGRSLWDGLGWGLILALFCGLGATILAFLSFGIVITLGHGAKKIYQKYFFDIYRELFNAKLCDCLFVACWVLIVCCGLIIYGGNLILGLYQTLIPF